MPQKAELRVKGVKQNYNWELRAEQTQDGFVRLKQKQCEPNGLQVILLSPQQMDALADYAD